MRRFCLLALLTLLSSSAHAGSFSFSVSGEGKGGVRITRCGRALCGYVINVSNDRGEAVLVNMKPKSDTQWTGNVVTAQLYREKCQFRERSTRSEPIGSVGSN